MAPQAFSQLRARIALGASSLVGVQGYLTGWYWQRSVAARDDVPLLAALTHRCCMNGGTFLCDGGVSSSSGRYRNAQYYGSRHMDPSGLTLSVTDHKKPRLLPGSYHGSQAKPSPWQSVPLSNRAAFSSNPRRTPQSTHLNPGQLPGLPRPWPGNDSPLASRPLLNAPLSLAPLNLADFSRIKTGQAATFSSQASPEVMSTFSNPSHLTSERAIRGDRHQFDATDLSDGTANHVANLAEESADIERRALSGQAAFSGRTSESASPNTPCRAPLERVDWSDLQPECSQPSTAGGGSVKAERSPERAQMDPPLLYRASSARPRQGDYQQGQMGARDTHVRGMHLQTKPAEEWSFDGDEFKSVQWGSIPAEAFERFNWAYSRLEMVPSSTGRFVAVEFATPNHADADSMDGSLEWTGAGSGASVFQSEKSLRSWDEGLRGRGVEMEEIGGEQLGDVVGAKDKLGGYQEVEWLGAAVIKEGCECGVVEERNVRHGRTEEEAVPWREGWSGVPDGAMSGERRVVSGAEVEGTLADGTLEREPTTFGAQQLERGDAPGTGERAEAASVVGAEETRKGGFAEGSLEQDGGPLEGTVMVAAPAAKVSTRPEPLVESGLSNVRQGSAMGGEVVEVRKDALRREGLEGIESDAAFVAGWERIRVEGEGALEGVEEALLEEAKLGVREMEVRLGEEMVSGASSGGEELVQNAGGVELEAWLGAGEEAGVLRGGESEPGWVPVQTEEEATSVVEVWEGEEGARDVLGRVNKRGGREVWLREKPELGGSSTRLLSKDVWRRVPPAAQTEPSSQTEDQRGGNVRRKELGRIRGGSEETGGAEGSRGVRGAVRSSLQDADRRKEGWVPKRARLESQASPSESWTPDDVSRVGFEAEAQSAERSGMLSWTDLMAPAASAKSFRGVDDVSRVGFEVEAQLGDKSGMLSWADLMAPAAKAEDASPPKRMLSWAELMQQVGPPVDAAAGRELPASEAADKSVAKRDEELCDGRVVENGVEAVEGGLAGSACTVLEAAPGKAWGDWEESLDGGVAYHEAKGGAVAEAGRESLKEERQNLTVGAAKGSRLGGVDAEARREELAAVEKPHEGTISEEGLRSSTLEAEARTRVGRVGAEGEHRKEAAAAKGALELTIISTQAEGVTGAASKAVRETLGEPEETRLGRSEVQSESDTWKHEETMSSGASPAVRSEGRAGPQPESKQARSVERAANKMMTRGQLVEALGKAGSVHEVARMVEQVKGGLKARDEVPIMKALRSNGQPVPPYLFANWALSRPERRPSRYLVAQAIPAASAVGRLAEVERRLFEDLAASQKLHDVRDNAALLEDDVSTRMPSVEGAPGLEAAEASVLDSVEGVGVEARPGTAAAEDFLAETFVCNALLEAYVNEGRWQEALAVFDAMRPAAGVADSEGEDRGVVSREGEGEPSGETVGGVVDESLEDWTEYGDPDLDVEGPVRKRAEPDKVELERGTKEGEGVEIVREDFGWLEQTFQEWLHRDVDRRGGLKHWKDGLPLELPRGMPGLAGTGARDVFSYNLAIRACLRGRLEMARIWTLWDQMEREGLRPDRVTYNLTIAACSKLPEGTAHFTTRARGEDALALIDEMQQRGIPPNVYTYTAAIDAWARANQGVARALQRAEPSAMVSLFEKMLHEGQKPTVVTYGALVNGFAQMGALEDAELAFENLLGSETKPNAGVVNALLAGCELADDFDRARGWVERLEKGGVFRSEETRARLLSVRVNTGGAEWVATWCEELREETGSFLGGMRALSQEIVSGNLPRGAPHTNEAEDTLAEAPGPSVREAVTAKASPLQPSELATEIVNPQSSVAESSFGGMESEGSGQIDAALYKVLIQALAKVGRFSELAPVLREMAGSAATPDVVLINIVLDTCARVNDWEITDAIVEALGQLARAAKQREVPPMGARNGLSVESSLALGQSGNGGEVEATATGANAPVPIHSTVSPRHAAGEKRHPHLPAAFFSFTSELLAAQIDDVTVRARARALLALLAARGESPETVLAFFSTLCDALWSFGWEKRASLVAGALIGPGFQRGFKDRRPVSKASDKEWALDVRRLGKGAGQAVLFLWLQRAREEFLAGGSPPGRIAIITGFDGRKWAKGEMRAVIEEQIEALGAPCRFSGKNPGRFVGNGFDVREWLMEDGMGAKLALSDGAEEPEQAFEAAG